MSVEEDTELRDLIAQTLETNGCLAKIRAQLRASIFLALDEDESLQKKEPLFNRKIKEHLESTDGRTMFCLVREFLEFFDLDFTISVYEPESYMGAEYNYEGRCKVIEDLGIPQLQDNSAIPLLLQLIHIAQVKNGKECISIDLNQIQNTTYDQQKSDSYVNNSDSQIEITNSENTDKDDDISFNKSDISERHCPSISEQLIISKVSNVSNQSEKENNISEAKLDKLNETFDVRSPCFNNSQHSSKHESEHNKISLSNASPKDKNINQKDINTEVILCPNDISLGKDESEKDDTFEGTSSIMHDSVQIRDEPLIDLDKSVKLTDPSNSVNDTERSKSLIDQTIVDTEFSPPIVKDSKHSKHDTFEKLKLSPQKTEKLKGKSSLSSLSDLPPLQMNKSRSNDMILPSLYSKEFKEKTSLKDIDKMFDLESLDNYEEDFMSGSEIDLVLNKTDALMSDTSKVNLLEDLKQPNKLSNGVEISSKLNNSNNKKDKNREYSNSSVTYSNKSGSLDIKTNNFEFDNINNKCDDTNSTKAGNFVREKNNSSASSITSEDFDINANDDILNSC